MTNGNLAIASWAESKNKEVSRNEGVAFMLICPSNANYKTKHVSGQ